MANDLSAIAGALIRVLDAAGKPSPDTFMPLSRNELRDDVAYVYRATYAKERDIVRAIVPDGTVAARIVAV